MDKYIHDCFRNNSRNLTKDMNKPEEKAFHEIVKGILVKESPILKQIGSIFEVKPKKQAEKFSRHLRKMKLKEKVDDFALNKAQKSVKEDAVIAYDLTDIAKPYAKKIEKITKIFDGSQRKVEKGFFLHGVGINGFLVKLEIHDNDALFLAQIRKKIVQSVAQKLHSKGIWVFDRGNDDKQFFDFLSQDQKLRFVARLRLKRNVCDAKTGVILKLENLPCGSYEVFLLENGKPDLTMKYKLIIHSYSPTKKPIILLTNLENNFSERKIVETYLARWGVESAFRRIKMQFNLEKIRVLKYQNLNNLVAIIQFIFNVLKHLFDAANEHITFITSGLMAFYKDLLKTNSLKKNEDSFFAYIKELFAKMRIRRQFPPPKITTTQLLIPFKNSS